MDIYTTLKMLAEKNVWMFRTLDNHHCLVNNTVNYGWSDYDLQEWANRSSEDKREEFGSRVREVACALAVKKGDIIVMPLKWEGGVAIARVLSEHIEHSDSEELYANDMSNYFNVEWLTQFYNRTDLPAEIQSTLKYRRSILNIDYYRAEFDQIIANTSSGVLADEERYSLQVAEGRKSDINDIHTVISTRQARMSDTDFERFVLDLLMRSFNLEGVKNTGHLEATDGRDLMVYSNSFQGLGLQSISWNVQVKQHAGETDEYAVNQVSMSDNSEMYVHNVVVSSTRFSEKAKSTAKERNVVLIDGENLSEIIYDNFDKIPLHYKRKLGFIQSLKKV
jgi:predicted Mrr-cat superfamily restriction endonuclease